MKDFFPVCVLFCVMIYFSDNTFFWWQFFLHIVIVYIASYIPPLSVWIVTFHSKGMVLYEATIFLFCVAFHSWICNIFYIWNNNTINSIFKIYSGTCNVLNHTTHIGDSFIDATVTNDDKVFSIVTELGNIYLKQIISDGNYPILYNFGTTGTFAIDTLDNNNLIIAPYGNTESYNGLFIYNIKDRKIEKIITTEDVIALCVPR